MRVYQFRLTLILLFTCTSWVAAHDFYISLTEVYLSPEDTSLHITVKSFDNDMEDALSALYPDSISLADDSSGIPFLDSLVFAYLNSVLSVKVDTVSSPYEFVGWETENGVFFGYVEIKQVVGFEQIEVTNRLLFELFENQVNMIKVIVGRRKKTLLLNAAKDTDMVKF